MGYLSLVARALATATLLACGCTQRAAPPPPPRPAPVPSAAPAPPPVPALELASAPPVEPVQLSILQPPPGTTLEPAEAARTEINLHTARPDWLVEVALDGRRARPLATLPEKPTLGDLAEGELAQGRHYLLAALRASEHEPAQFAIARFEVGGSGAGVAAEPIVYCGRPSGTYYVQAGAPLLLDFAVDAFELGASGGVLVRAERAGAPETRREARLRDRAPRLVHGLAGGDWAVELQLTGADGAPLASPLARHRCELTLNEAAP